MYEFKSPLSRPRVLVGTLLLLLIPTIALPQDPARDKLVVETLLRLKRFDISDNDKLRDAVLRHMKTLGETDRFVDLAVKFEVKEVTGDLIKLAQTYPNATLGVEAINAVLKLSGTSVVEKALNTDDVASSVALIQVLGQSTSPEVPNFLIRLYQSTPRNRQLYVNTALSIARTIPGQRFLLAEAKAGRLRPEVTFAVGNALYASADKDIQERAKATIKLPTTADSKPLPPLDELARLSGSASLGKALFFTKGTCAKCHKVGDQGKEVGPALSEIGTKLSKEALFTSMLDPSAGVSHNYETYSIVTLTGNIVTGIKINETDEEVTLRTAEGIDKTFKRSTIDEVFQTGVSLMPADLQRLLSVKELADIVAYLRTLTKK